MHMCFILLKIFLLIFKVIFLSKKFKLINPTVTVPFFVLNIFTNFSSFKCTSFVCIRSFRSFVSSVFVHSQWNTSGYISTSLISLFQIVTDNNGVLTRLGNYISHAPYTTCFAYANPLSVMLLENFLMWERHHYNVPSLSQHFFPYTLLRWYNNLMQCEHHYYWYISYIRDNATRTCQFVDIRP